MKVLVTVGTTSHDVLISLCTSTSFASSLISTRNSLIEANKAPCSDEQKSRGSRKDGLAEKELDTGGSIKVWIQYGGMDKDVIENRLTKALQPFMGTNKKAPNGAIPNSSTISTTINSTPISFIFFPYTPNLPALTSTSDLILTHCGAGSVLESYRSPSKPAVVVVPNETLMDNHQLELAEVVGGMGMGVWVNGEAGKGVDREAEFALYVKEYVCGRRGGNGGDGGRMEETNKINGRDKFRSIFKESMERGMRKGDRSGSQMAAYAVNLTAIYVAICGEMNFTTPPSLVDILLFAAAFLINHAMAFYRVATRDRRSGTVLFGAGFVATSAGVAVRLGSNGNEMISRTLVVTGIVAQLNG